MQHPPDQDNAYDRVGISDCTSLRAGVDAKTVSTRLGHATVAFTLDVYTKAVPQLDRDAADKIAGLIFDRDA